MGRNRFMHKIINSILKRRVVIVRGGKGLGKTALLVATGKYLLDRRHFPAIHVDLSEAKSVSGLTNSFMSSLMQFRYGNLL